MIRRQKWESLLPFFSQLIIRYFEVNLAIEQLNLNILLLIFKTYHIILKLQILNNMNQKQILKNSETNSQTYPLREIYTQNSNQRTIFSTFFLKSQASKNQESYNFCLQIHKTSMYGGPNILSNTDQEQISAYYSHLNLKKRKEITPEQWLDSIKTLKRLIDQDSVLAMHWKQGFSKSTKLLPPNMSGDDVLDLVDIACKTPPIFTFHPFVGFPINAIFLEFMQNENGRAFFGNEKVNAILKEILNDYYKMLQSEASLQFMNSQSPSGWFCRQAQTTIVYQQFLCQPQKQNYGFKNWNQWFLRKFKPLARVIGYGSPPDIDEENIIINSCESSPLTTPMQPQLNVKGSDFFWLKDNLYSLKDMFGSGKFNKQHLVDHFIGGTVYQAYLSALTYHRWHSPVNGTIEEVYNIPGTYYLTQSQFIPYDESAPNMSESFLSAVATRLVIVIKANNPLIGKIGIIYIGMGEVSTCIATVKVGDKVKKGQQLGYFQFGGSSHAIIFQKNAKLIFNPLHYQQNNRECISLLQKVNSFLAYIDD